jgi:hypothetical protein
MSADEPGPVAVREAAEPHGSVGLLTLTPHGRTRDALANPTRGAMSSGRGLSFRRARAGAGAGAEILTTTAGRVVDHRRIYIGFIRSGITGRCHRGLHRVGRYGVNQMILPQGIQIGSWFYHSATSGLAHPEVAVVEGSQCPRGAVLLREDLASYVVDFGKLGSRFGSDRHGSYHWRGSPTPPIVQLGIVRFTELR